MPNLSRGIHNGTMSRPEAAAGGAAPDYPSARGAAGIAAYLRRAILDGVYLYGERLPAERQLAGALSSSRSTVREALGILEQNNFITRRVGSGTFVTYTPETAGDDVAEITSPLELIEVRLGVEPYIMRLAAINATAKDIDRVRDALSRLDKPGIDANNFTKWDRQFHQLLADATHNPLMISIYQHVNHVRGHAQWSEMKDKILTAERIAGYNRQHVALYQALRSRDADAAARIVTEHLDDARRDLLAT